MIKKDARYHAFKILLDFERSKKQLKLVRNQYYDSYSVSGNDKIRSFIKNCSVCVNLIGILYEQNNNQFHKNWPQLTSTSV